MPESKLTQKLAKILGEVGRVPKKGHNDFHGYDYVMEADLVEAVREKLSTEQIFIYTVGMRAEVVEMQKTHPKTGEVTTNRVPLLFIEYAFVDGETGEEKRVWGVGEIDQDGGKGIYKAQTGSEKYMLMKNFLIATGDDPERDGRRAPQAAPQKGQQSPSRASARPQAGGRPEAGFPATSAQKNCIMRHWGELSPQEQQKMQDWMNGRGIVSEGMTKRQASDVIDEMLKIKQGRKAAAAPVAPQGAPPPITDPLPSAEQIEAWATEIREQQSVFHLNQAWFRIKPLPKQAHQQKYLQEVRETRIRELNSSAASTPPFPPSHV